MPPRKKAPVAASEGHTPEELVAAINKRFGEGSVTFASDPDIAVTRLPTGVYPVDDLFDGGLPQGRFIEIFGPYSTMKSYIAYKALGSVQRLKKVAALIDLEHSFDPEWATRLGVDVKSLMIMRPETAEEAIAMAEALCRNKVALIVFDSIAAAQPKQYRDAEPGDDNAPGALARVMSKGLARLNSVNSVTTVIFINQTRTKIGVSFGSPITTSGGLAMGFYASYRVSLARIDKIKEDYQQWDGEKWVTAKRIVAHKIRATLEKSKLSAPHGDVIFTYDLRTGEIDETGYIVAKALEAGLLGRSSAGHWSSPYFEGTIHGRDKFFAWLDENPDVVEALKEAL